MGSAAKAKEERGPVLDYYAGLFPEDVDDMFDEGNRMQDWSRSEKLLWEQNNRHKFWAPPEH